VRRAVMFVAYLIVRHISNNSMSTEQ
jgi:hypothetical protein